MPWSHLAANTGDAFWNPTTDTALAVGIVSTVVMSPHADHGIRVAIHRTIGSDSFGSAMVVTGYVAPVLVPLTVFAVGLASPRQRAWATAGAAAAQAVFVTVLTNTLIKGVTGRPFPMHGGDPNAPDRFQHPEYAREWHPFQPALGQAWPSGHSAAAFSLAAGLTASTGNVYVGLVSYSAAATIAGGMLIGDKHWASDVVAGTLLGLTVGDSIGRSFRRRFLEPKHAGAPPRSMLERLSLTPLVGSHELGLQVTLLPSE